MTGADDSELQALRNEVAALRREVAALRSLHGDEPSAVRSEDPAAALDDAVDASPHSTSRRNLIKLATGAVAAGSAASLATSKPAAAGTSDIQFGLIKEYTGAQTTARRNPGGGSGVHGFMFQAGGSDGGFSSNFPCALAGWSRDGARPHGVYGASNSLSGIGVVGTSFATGGVGVAGDGDLNGVRGTSRFTGVAGTATTTFGSGLAGTGGAYGARLVGEAAALRFTTGAVVPPPQRSDLHAAGEIEGSDGASDIMRFWACVESGTPGTWRELAGPGTAGSLHVIEPTRVYDSRKAQPNPGPLASGQNRTVSVADGRDVDTGAVTDTDVVPAGATAVTYNLTIADTTGAGFLSVTPGDAATLKASTINWSSGGLTLANAGVVKLDAARQVKVFCGTGSTDFIVDITGYYL